MKSAEVSVSEAARHLSEYVDQVQAGTVEYRLLKDGRPVARLVHDSLSCSAQELAAVWDGIHLSSDEAQALRLDLEATRRELPPLGDKWQ